MSKRIYIFAHDIERRNARKKKKKKKKEYK